MTQLCSYLIKITSFVPKSPETSGIETKAWACAKSLISNVKVVNRRMDTQAYQDSFFNDGEIA